ncbi:Tn3 family transposase [Nonomuraea sp. NPDC004354]
MTTELLNKAQSAADKEKVRKHPKLAKASARLAVAVEALFDSDSWGGEDEEPRVSVVWEAIEAVVSRAELRAALVKADYGPLGTLARGRIDLHKVRRTWPDILRVGASIYTGTVRAYDVVTMLQREGQPHRTDETYRRDIKHIRNLQEGRHALARKICHGKKGELYHRYERGLENQLGVLGIVLNCVVLWTTVYLDAALRQLKAQDYPVGDEDMARLSPFVNTHLGAHGAYIFVLPDLAPGAIRDLRDPDAPDADDDEIRRAGSWPNGTPGAWRHLRHEALRSPGMGGRFWSSVYLLFIWFPVLPFLDTEPPVSRVVLAVGGLLGFVACYLRVAWTALASPRRNATPWALGLLYVLWIALVPPLGDQWLLISTYFTVAALVASVPRRAMFAGMAVIVAAYVGGLLYLDLPLSGTWWMPLQPVLFAGLIDMFLRFREERTRAEQLAVENERLRFSRDMHDIIGHSLSVMTLKTQLADRLIERDPARAREEIRQLEGLSRQALEDVREAVSGYRSLSLREELTRAREALTAAGIHAAVAADDVPADAASLLAWVVREGTTNVVRHSRASHCEIKVFTDGDHVVAEVSDDGLGSGKAPGDGNGLRGLSERLDAVGGTLEHSATDEGFILRARLPA